MLSGILFRTDACSVWNDLKERFDKVNLTRFYHLQKEIVTLTQGVSFVSTYYYKLKDLWDEVDSIVPPPSCYNKSKDFVKHLSNQRLLQFLMGLNDGYNQARSHILIMNPTPSVNQAYAIIVRDESPKLVSGAGYTLGTNIDPQLCSLPHVDHRSREIFLIHFVITAT